MVAGECGSGPQSEGSRVISPMISCEVFVWPADQRGWGKGSQRWVCSFTYTSVASWDILQVVGR